MIRVPVFCMAWILVGCADAGGKPSVSGDTADTDTLDTDTGEDTDSATDTDTDTDTEPVPTDADGDGYSPGDGLDDDCDDADPNVHPWAEEFCEDGRDTNCDGIDGRCGAWESGSMAYVADAAFWGENPGDAAGRDVLLEDMSGDGLDDALILAPFHGRYTRDASALYVAFAPFEETGIPLSLVETRIDGEETDEQLNGMAVGDVDGDGVRDLLVGSGSSQRVHLLLGPIVGEVGTGSAAWTAWNHEADSASLGAAVELVDLDGDRVDELAFSAYAADYGRGVVYVVSSAVRGRTGFDDLDDLSLATMRGGGGGHANAYLGLSLAHADLDGDGVDDLLIGGTVPSTGAAVMYLLLAPVEGSRTTGSADGAIAGEGWGGGPTVVEPGDVDGDGSIDLVLGAPGDGTTADRAGAVYVAYGYSGGELQTSVIETKLLGTAEGDRAGIATALGDFDGNGRMDLAVGADCYGATESEAGVGGVFIILNEIRGGATLLEVSGALWTGRSHEYLGAALAVGEVDGDDVSDLLVGADMLWGKATEPGAAYLMHGL